MGKLIPEQAPARVRMKIMLMISSSPNCFAGLAVCRVATTSIMCRIVFCPRHRLV
jgi:hypothetical protein